MGYTARQVARALDLTPAQLRSLAKAGHVEATDGRYSFQDMVLLRTAKELRAARVPPRHIRESIGRLREQQRAVRGLEISAEGRRVVVQDGDERWEPRTGQLVMLFDPAPAAPIVERDGRSAESWFDEACELETERSEAECAIDAYRRALELDPKHVDAHVNLGRLLHDAGDHAGAERHYRSALEHAPSDETARFNLGVVLEDMERWDEAINVYEQIDHADAHYNAAVLCERLGRRTEALRHFKRYRQLDS